MSTALRLRHHRLWVTLGWLLIALVIVLSLVPHPPDPLRVSDKIKHALGYGLLMAWFVQVYFSWRSRVSVAVLLTLLGALIEVLQMFSRLRHFDVADMAANSIGIVVAWVIIGATPLSRVLLALERRLFR